jgi:hypothetical protein
MAREPWKCSHANCKQESGRNWNLKRHITRLHKGDGIPVKNKSSDTEKLARGTQYTGNIEGLYPRNSIVKEENNKKRQGVKTTGELDPVDSAYQMFKKLKDRNDKIEEMRNYFANNSSKIPSPPNFPHDIFNYNKVENVLPYHIWSEFSSASILSPSVPSASVSSTSSTSQVDKVQTKKVVGYVGYTCRYCLEFEPLQVVYDPSASDKISGTRHVCDPDTLNSVRAYPAFFREDVYMYRILDLSEQMIKAVKEWTNGEVFLISDKITSSNIPENTIIIDLRRNEHNWLTRAIVQKCMVLDNKELKEFFTLILDWCATFCCLCINFVDKKGQHDVKQEYCYLFLSYKLCLPWELR